MGELTYYIEVADPFGTKLAQVDRFVSIDLVRGVNAVGVLTLEMDPDTSRDLFRLDGRLGVWRQPANGPRELLAETVFLVRRVRRALSKSGERVLQVTALSAAHLIDRRIVAYPAGSAQADKTGPADDLMKAIIRENLGSLAPAGRDWSALISVAADSSQGPSVSKGFAWRYCLDVLQELGEQAAQAGNPVYFDFVAPVAGGLEFRTYTGQRGLNRSLSSGDPLILSPERGNLADCELIEDYTDEATHIYAGGQGEQADREIAEASDAARVGGSPFGRIEAWRDARNTSTTAALQAEANAALWERRPRRIFSGSIQDTPQCAYGIHWRWGDLVVAQFEGRSYDCHVDTVRIKVAKGAESISAQLRAEEWL